MYLDLWLYVYEYTINSYEGSSSKWYLLRGAKHPGMATVDRHKNRIYITNNCCDSIREK